MAKLSRRELARVAGGMSAAQALKLAAQIPAQPAYIGPLTGVTMDLSRPPIRSGRIHARAVRGGPAALDSARAIAAKPRGGRRRCDRS